MASIYRADAGTVRMAGRVAPFIELGVGFNPELTARENGVLNGVLMGLTMREARRRLDAMLDFAELQDFVDLKLKNYSSGMMVRLAFAVMVQADADVMLIDEVLAVGDAAFMQKCMDLFHERRRAGKTIVLVTHDMATVQSLCDRALLLHDGELQFVGEPEEAALRYLRMNFGGQYSVPAEDAESVAAVPEFNVRTVRAQLLGAGHEPVANVELGRPLELDVVLEAVRALERPSFVVNVLNEDGLVVFGFKRVLEQPVPLGGADRPDRRGREPARPGPLLPRLLGPQRPGPRLGRRPGAAAAAVRRLRHRRADGAGRGARRRRAAPGAASDDRRDRRAARDPRAACAGRRAAAGARAAVPDRRHRLQADLLRHRLRLPLVARAAADAVRRAARRVHAGLPDRLGRAALSRAAAVQHRAVRVLPGGHGRGGQLARVAGADDPQDAVPAARRAAGRGAHEPVQPGAQPRRRVRSSCSRRACRRCGAGSASR